MLVLKSVQSRLHQTGYALFFEGNVAFLQKSQVQGTNENSMKIPSVILGKHRCRSAAVLSPSDVSWACSNQAA